MLITKQWFHILTVALDVKTARTIVSLAVILGSTCQCLNCPVLLIPGTIAFWEEWHLNANGKRAALEMVKKQRDVAVER